MENSYVTVIKNCLLAFGLTVLLPAAHAQVNADVAMALAEKNLCLSCHKMDQKLVGPAFRDVAKKYQGVAEAQARLIANIRKGAKGVWGPVPIPPQTNLSDDEIKTLVAWILSLSCR